MKPFTCSLPAAGLNDKNRCKNTIFSTLARVSSKKNPSYFLFWKINPQIMSFHYELTSKDDLFTEKNYYFTSHPLTKQFSLLIFAT